MSEASYAARRSPLEVGVLITLVTIGFAAVIGFIAVIDADHVAAGFGTGLGVTFVIFLGGGTIACALGCLRRGKAEIVALGSIIASGLAIDMFVLAIWREIDNEAYGKIAAVAFAWSFFALIILGLTLAVGTPRDLARSLYLGAIVTTVVAGLISTWLIAKAGNGGEIAAGEVPENGGFGGLPYGAIGDDELLRVLGASLVLLAAFWRSARGEPPRAAAGGGHTLKRTLRMSPSSTT